MRGFRNHHQPRSVGDKREAGVGEYGRTAVAFHYGATLKQDLKTNMTEKSSDNMHKNDTQPVDMHFISQCRTVTGILRRMSVFVLGNCRVTDQERRNERSRVVLTQALEYWDVLTGRRVGGWTSHYKSWRTAVQGYNRQCGIFEKSLCWTCVTKIHCRM